MALQAAHVFGGTYWIEDDRLLVGPYPGGWHPAVTRDRLTQVMNAGATYLLDLTEPGEMEPYNWLLGRHIRYRRCPLPGAALPARSDIIQVLNQLDRALAEQQVVYLHCLASAARASTVIGCWLVRHGLPGDQAVRQITDLQHWFAETPQSAAQQFLVRTWYEPSASAIWRRHGRAR